MSQPCGAQHDTRAVCVQAVISKRELTPTSGVYQAVYPLLMRRPAPAGRAAAARARGRARKARRRLGGRRVSARARPRAERLARGGPALRSPGRRPPYIRPALYEAARPRGARRGCSRARPRPRCPAAAWGQAHARPCARQRCSTGPPRAGPLPALYTQGGQPPRARRGCRPLNCSYTACLCAVYRYVCMRQTVLVPKWQAQLLCTHRSSSCKCTLRAEELEHACIEHYSRLFKPAWHDVRR